MKRLFALFIVLIFVFSPLSALAQGGGYAVITVEKFSIGQGFILEPTKVRLLDGETASDFLIRVIGENNLMADLTWGFYLTAVKDEGPGEVPANILERCGLHEVSGRQSGEWLAMGDYTSSSGFMYTVNDESPLVGMNEYILKDGDVLRVQFSMCDWGADIGLGYETNHITPVNKADIIRRLADLAESKALFSGYDREIYQNALSVVADLAAGESEVLAALESLDEINRPTFYGEAYELPEYDWAGALNTVLDKYEEQAPNLSEWALFALARQRQVDGEAARAYAEKLAKTLEEKNGVLDGTKYTEYSRVVLALTALGIDPRAEAVYDLVKNITDLEKVRAQGINGVIFAVLALNSKNFGDSSKMVEYIKSCEKESGGFSLDSKSSSGDVDITAMALQCLAPYKNDKEISEIIERALYFLQASQNSYGGFVDSSGVVTAESTAQVILALCALGINPEYDSRFMVGYGNPVSALMSFYIDGEGFAHMEGGAVNPIATEQGVMALAAYKRFKDGASSLFDLSDVEIHEIKLPKKEEDSPKPVAEVLFEDIKNHWGEEIIGFLAERGIVSGFSKTEFAPNRTMTRAEFAKIIIDALGHEADKGADFSDVSKEAWYYKYIGTAKEFGIVSGVTKTEFYPNAFITREAAAAMTARAAKIAGLDTELYTGEDRDVLSGFLDYTECSEWSRESVAACVKLGLFSSEELYFRPNDNITRAEVCAVVYRLIKKIG